ncbi:MAG TPA: hypothetical protein VLB68_17280 [Pyrinomonadaceae bacterium]|nr:hypothetical protein [Pyrinomonadaceae bacterium]
MEIRCWEGCVAPRGLDKHVHRALSYIEPEDLLGIDHILLLANIPEDSRDSDVIQAIAEDQLILGAYKRRRGEVPAHIILIVGCLYKPMPRVLRGTSAMILRIAETIGHEVGHHLIAEKRFARRPKHGSDRIETEEEFADRYALSVSSRMKRRFFYRLGSFLTLIAAARIWQKGVRAWDRKEYGEAAKYFDMAMKVKLDYPDGAYWYQQARDKGSK